MKKNIIDTGSLKESFLFQETRSHYPPDSPYLQRAAPYRDILPSDHKQIHNCEYIIGSDFDRFHGNPPIWNGHHFHPFRVEITLSTILKATDLYGVDMIEAEKVLKTLCDRIPQRVNDLECCKTGTTESLCLYFMNNFSLPDSLVYIKKVMVSENKNRKTIIHNPMWKREVIPDNIQVSYQT